MLDGLHQRYRKWLDNQFEPEFLQKIMALPTRQNEYGYDAFGFNRDEAKIAILLTRWLYKRYFRVETHGIENIPRGRVLLASNHSGQLPFDGWAIGGALIFDLDPPRVARSMIDRFVPTLPYISFVFNRWGQIVGTPENCLRLLMDEEAILVFPEGTKGISKPFSQRYQLQPFGHGFMRLALEAKAPVVPVAVIGAEEQAPAFNMRPLARMFKVPSFPLMPVPPFFPILPLPTKYRIHFGQPMTFEGDTDQDDQELEPMVLKVQRTIQSMIHMGLKARKHVFW